MDNVNADFTINSNNPIEAEFSLGESNLDCTFELFAAGTTWGSISGELSNQTDLQDALDAKQDVLTAGEGIDITDNVISNTQTSAEWGNIQGTLSNQTDLQDALNAKQDTISDLSTIRSNASKGASAYGTIQNYGDIVTYNAANFATSAQGELADTALQPGDDISELVNDAGYITGINSTDVTTALGYTPYDASNPAGYITSAALPTNYVTTNTAQTISSSKAFSQPIVMADNNGLASGTILSNKKILQRSSGDNTLTLNNIDNKLRLIGSETRPKYSTDGTNWTDLALTTDVQTYSAGTGIDITSNTVSVTSPTVIDNATGTHSIAIGDSSQSTAEGSVAVGDGSKANSTYSTAVGYNAQATNTNSVAIGKQAKATAARTVAIGSGAEANANDAYVIKGINNTANTFQVGSYTMLDTSTGLIPDARISSNIATTNYVDNAISTNTADFDGSWATYADIPLTEAGFTSEGFPAPSNNNYLVVLADERQDGGTWRYKYIDYGLGYDKIYWAAEYRINETPLTQAQLDALNSGITSGDVALIGTAIQPGDNVSDLVNDSAYIANTATGSNAITISGTATAKTQGINIGGGSQVTGNYGVALGCYAYGNGSQALGLGNYARATANYAIQIGKGTNSTASTLQIGFDGTTYQLLDGTTGLIPDARISSNIARTSDIPSVSGFLQNTATGTDSLTILGIDNATYEQAINIGDNSTINGDYSVAIGGYESTYGETQAGTQGVALGVSANTEAKGVAIGYGAYANTNGISIGTETLIEEHADNSIAIGYQAQVDGATYYGDTGNNITNAIQLGSGVNETSDTLQVGNYTLLDTSTGLIPDARISTNIARSADITSLSGYLQNTATGSSALTILGTANAKSNSINIGSSSTVTGNQAVVIGNGAGASGVKSSALGYYAKANAAYAIQLGQGTNSTANTLSIGFPNYDGNNNSANYRLLDGTTGLIPDARISTNIARSTDIPTDNSSLTNGAGYITGITSTDVTTSLGYTPVNKAGDTMTGDLALKFSGLDLTTTVSTNSYYGIEIQDTNGNRVGRVEGFQKTDGSYGISVGPKVYGASTYPKLDVWVDSSDVSHSSFPKTTCCDGQWVAASHQIASSVGLNGSTNLSYDLTSFIPKDGYAYEILLSVRVNGSSTNNQYSPVYVGTSLTADNYLMLSGCRQMSATTNTFGGASVIPLGTNRILTVSRSTGYYGTIDSLDVKAYRRVGTNS